MSRRVLFDRRHRWGPEHTGSRPALVARTCEVCGITREYETFIPTAFVDRLVAQLTRVNPYRELFR